MRIGIACAIMALSASCTQPTSDYVTRADFNAQVAEATKLQNAIEQLRIDLRGVQRRQFKRVMAATFDPSNDEGFQRVESDSGDTFWVSLENTSAYLDGFKVEFRLGNPTSAAFNNVVLNLKWGPRITNDNLGEWANLLKQKQVTLAEPIVAGSWNPVTVTLSPAKADAFGYVEVAIESDSVSLRKTR